MKFTHRIAALIMALMLVLSSTAAFADTALASAQQITNSGGTVYYDANGNKVTNATKLGDGNSVVEMTKTIAGTDTENEFEITLQVKTSENVEEISTESPDAAVLLVLDLSSSMNYTHKNGQTRLEAAKDAAKNFIDQFAALEGDGKRMVGLVTFGSNAHSHDLAPWYSQSTDYWVNLKDSVWVNGKTVTYADRVKDYIDSLYAPSNNGTNTEGGLMLARNLIKYGKESTNDIKGIDHIYTILLTDGISSYHVDSDVQYNRYWSSTYTDITGSKGGGSSATYNDVKDIGTIASEIRSINATNSLSKLYSICFGTSNGTDVWNTKPFTSFTKQQCDDARPQITYTTTTSPYALENQSSRKGEPSLSGNGSHGPGDNGGKQDNINVTMTVGEWLTAFSDAAYNGQVGNNGLFDSFNSILSYIQVAAQAWQVDDPMGAHIEYLNSVPVYNKAHTGTINNNATFDTTNNALHWNLLSSSPDDNITTLKTDNGTTTGTIGYTFKYRIRLNNLDGYTAGDSVATNGKTTLKYIATNEKGEWDYTLRTSEFLVPQVEGYEGNLTFTKTDDSNSLLPNVGFTLSLKGENGKTWTRTATSNDEGVVSFSNIPSGHQYTLSETTPLAGYAAAADIDVTVSYGTTTATGFTGTTETPTVINTKDVAYVEVSKKFEGLPTGMEPEITITLTDNNGKTYSKTFNTANGWTQTFTVEPGVTYTISETGADVEGYTLSSTNIAPSSVTVPTKGIANVTVTNTYAQKVGSLKLTKVNSGNTPTNVTFTVTPKGENTAYATFTLPDNGSWTKELTGVPIGDYTVTETSGAEITDYTLTVTGEGTYTVSEGVTTDVTITNSYAPNPGKLKLIKAIEADDGYVPGSVTLTVTPKGSTADSTASKNVVLSVDNTWTQEIELASGTYTITETAQVYDETNYTVTTEWSKQEVTIKAGQTTITDANTVTCTNTYTRKTGSLTITKTFAGATTVDPDMSFTVTYPDETTKTIYLKDKDGETRTVMTKNADGTYSITLEGVPTGEYTVVESGATVDGYNHTMTVKVNDAAATPDANGEVKATVAEKTNSSVAFTNTYIPADGKLKLVKVISAQGLTPNVESVELTVSRVTSSPIPNGNDQYSFIGKYTLNAQNNWTMEIDVTAGTYRVTETAQVFNSDDYSVETSWANQTVTVAPGQTTITDANTVTCTNTYTRKTGSLKISKEFSGLSQNATLPEKITFTVTLKGENTAYATFTLPDNGSWTKELTGVPTGAYTVTEVTDSAAVEGYNLEVSGAGEVTVVHNETAAVTIKNIYTPKTALKVELPVNKTAGLTGNVAPKGKHTFTFKATVTKQDSASSTTLSDEPVAVYPGEYKVMFGDKTLTPNSDGTYTFSLTIDFDQTPDEYNRWHSNDTLKVYANEVDQKLVITIEEIDESGTYPRWTYDDSSYTLVVDSINNDGTFTGSFTFEYSSYDEATDQDNRREDVTEDGDECWDSISADFFNAYREYSTMSVDIPLRKIVERGENGNADPTGSNTFHFALGLTEFDDDGEIKPTLSDFTIKLNGKTLKTNDGSYTFDLSVNGCGESNATLTVIGNAENLEQLCLTLFEMKPMDSTGKTDETWTYDPAIYEIIPTLTYVKQEGSGNGEFFIDYFVARCGNPTSDSAEYKKWDKDDITFKNFYNKIIVELPKTGDQSNLALWLALMVLSTAGLMVIAKRRRAE